jgi:hypothetical protein
LNREYIPFFIAIFLHNRVEFQERLLTALKCDPYELVELKSNASVGIGASILESEALVIDEEDVLICGVIDFGGVSTHS